MSRYPNQNASSAFGSRADNFPLRAGPAGEDSFLEYLRTAGGTVRDERPRPTLLDRQDSAERKRRHTGSEPQRRNYPYPTPNDRSAELRAGGPSSSGLPSGASRETAIDLTSPPRVPRAAFNDRRAGEGPAWAAEGTSYVVRRESDMATPTWQPDTDVSKCPVCNTDFSFWYRKHHCRKCGRVVCASCSPHRITIPRQYIVQQPQPQTYYEDESGSVSPAGSQGNPALGGGEVVRVCNPCVPDPWTPNSPAIAPTTTATTSALTNSGNARPTSPPQDPRLRQPERERPERYRNVPSGRNRSATYQTSSGFSRDPRLAAGMPASYAAPSQDGPYPQMGSRQHRHRYTQSGGHNPSGIPSHPTRAPPPIPSAARPIPSAAPPPVPQQSRPRREVREEDECPVCGTEMPPGAAVREAHIQECITSRFSSTPQPRSAPPAADALAAAPPPRETASNTPEGSRPRATSYRPRGMALYRATEKDCMTEEGEPQECVICFEEFEEGDEMGRMECLCKFHRTCIRQWWNTKGQGSCPTHQLHE